MPVLSRSALEASPLADLHAIASELGIDGFRRLRKSDLIDAILDRQGGEAGDGAEPEEAASDAEPEVVASDAEPDAEARPRRRRSLPRAGPSRRGRRGRRRRGGPAPAALAHPARRPPPEEEPAANGERVAEGVVDIQGNGSGFVRVDPAGPSDDDVYLSAAQVRRCELVSGDRVSGPVRPPRRSERYASLVRVDTINGAPADEVSGTTPFDDLPATWPAERIALDSDDPTLKAIEWLTPIGRGSRVTIVGAARAGQERGAAPPRRRARRRRGPGRVRVVLAGVRPEEVAEWRAGPVEPVAALTFAASPDAQSQAVERAIDAGKRVAARGGHAVVLIDGLDGLTVPAARKALAAARSIGSDGGSLTVIATAALPSAARRPSSRWTPTLTADRALPGARPRRQRHAAPRAARGRGRRGGDRAGPGQGAGGLAGVPAHQRRDRPEPGRTCRSSQAASRRTRRCARGPRLGAARPRPVSALRPRRRSLGIDHLTAGVVGDPAPGGLGGQLDRLAVAVGLHVGEGVRLRVEGDVELALLDALVQPGGAEDEPPQPVHERAVGRADELGPAVVDVLAQRPRPARGSRR